MGEIDRGVELRKTDVAGMETLFANRGWSAQQLFTRGDPTFRGGRDFGDFVFGSLLHMIEDSFVASHVERDEPSGAKCKKAPEHSRPGKILNFHSYIKQDKKKHGREDGHDALDIHLLTKQPNVVEVGKIIKSYYDARRPWTDLHDYLECIFEIDDSTSKAGPGDLFSINEEGNHAKEITLGNEP